MENMIETKDVIQKLSDCRWLKELVVLKNINIQIPTGKLTMLRGRSGSGKNDTDESFKCTRLSEKAAKFYLKENRFKICRNMTGSRCGKRRLDLFFSRWH